jgi:hypothetical protein
VALITETGAGLPDAESYCTVAYADQYHEQRANTSWSGLETLQKEAYLRRATEYMLAIYRLRWKGARVTASQGLDWPRVDVKVADFIVAEDSVPAEVQKACAILALKATRGELDPDPTQAVKRTKVDVIEKEYFEPTSTKRHKVVDDLLEPFLAGSTMNVKLVRA